MWLLIRSDAVWARAGWGEYQLSAASNIPKTAAVDRAERAKRPCLNRFIAADSSRRTTDQISGVM
jgi:hypothetical protein